jgi:uncharacterized C2H2 Zn-finger protein
MSTGKRLAKRSIIGTRVCAQGIDGLWYSGVIQTVDTPSSSRENNNCINITPNTKYTVRFDSKDMSRRGLKKEFRESELIGPGFRTIMDVSLRPGQKIFITYNGRESAGEVITHDLSKDEVNVTLQPLGYETPLELKKRLEEVRLLESRRSARLADQDRDTDFARLADMGGDRRRPSHSIDVPFTFSTTSRKRRPSYSQDDIYGINDDQMDECNAALVLMSLSCSPHSPQAGQWNTGYLGSSAGSSSSTWSSGSSSPPLSDDGKSSDGRFRTSSISTSDEGIVMDYSEEVPKKRKANDQIFKCTWKRCGVIFTKKEEIVTHVRRTHLGPKKPRQSIDDDRSYSEVEEDSEIEEEFYYTEVEDELDNSANSASPPTLSHRDMARPPHEDPEYQRQIVGSYRQGLLALNNQSPGRSSLQMPVTLSPVSISNQPLIHHHTYTWSQQSPASPQKHVRLSPRQSTSYAPYPSPTYSTAAQNLTNTLIASQFNNHIQQTNYQHQQASQHHNTLVTPTSIQSSVIVQTPSVIQSTMSSVIIPHHTSQQTTIQHTNPTNSQSIAPIIHRSPLSPNRRTRGENKKCRKVYGMDKKESWCTQCKWKKACTRFGD